MRVAAALLRYLAADALRAERWVAPLTVYLVACAAGTAVGGTALGSYGLSASLLFPVAVWVGVGVGERRGPGADGGHRRHGRRRPRRPPRQGGGVRD